MDGGQANVRTMTAKKNVTFPSLAEIEEEIRVSQEESCWLLQ